MSTINVNCVDQVMAFTNMPVIASGDINADKIKFTFDSVWTGYSKICTFYQQKGEYYYGLIDSNNEVVIPSGVINKPGNIYFGVSGYKNGITRTSNVLTYAIVEGAYTEVDPTEGQNLVSLIQENVEEMREEFDSVVDNLAYLRLDGDNDFEYDEDTTNTILTALPSCIRGVTGTYTGTGTYGSSNKTSITFPFVPMFVMVYRSIIGYAVDTSGDYKSCLMWLNGQTIYDGSISGYDINFSLTNKTLSWYNADNDAQQCNTSGVTYNYIAFGLFGEVN